MIRFDCSGCGQAVEVDDGFAGQPVHCPHCRAFNLAPGEMPAEVPEVPVIDSAAEPAPEEPTLADLPQFEVRPYEPVSGYSAGGVAIMAGCVLLAAPLLGWLASVIGQFFYLVFIFPVLIGMALGGVGVGGARLGKVHSPLAGGLVGLLGGVVAMLCVHYFDYLRFVQELQADPLKLAIFDIGERLKEQAANPPVRPAKAPFDPQAALERLDRFTWWDYMDRQASSGVTIGRRRGHGFNIGYVGSFIYWLVEIGVVAGVVFAMTRKAAAAPFCVACNAWKQERRLGDVRMEPHGATAALKYGELARLAASARWNSAPLDLFAYVCPGCGTEGEVEVKLRQTTTNEKKQKTTTDLAFVTYPGAALPVLVAVVEPPEPPLEADAQ
jgi:DNA-directed RNA polymerase subunit RPC12/RpoP